MYGIEVKNNQGSVVVDSDFPCCYLVDEVVVTGAKGSTDLNDVWWYRFSQVGTMPFFNLSVGDWVAYGAPVSSIPYFFGNKPQFSVRRIRPINQITYTEDDYGMVIYDTLGQKVFSTAQSLLGVKGFSNDLGAIPSQGSFSSSISWVSPLSAEFYFIPYIDNQYSLVLGAIKRTSTTTLAVSDQRIADTVVGGLASNWLNYSGGKTSGIFA